MTGPQRGPAWPASAARPPGQPAAVRATPIKCVIWDIDNTLLDGVFLESASDGQPGWRLPPADPAMTAALAELADRGILHALASRNPPAAAGYAAQVTGQRFAAAECGWGQKTDAILRICAELGLAHDAVAFVDDEALDRAEVSFALPEITVLAPEEMTEALGWPAFRPPVITDEARGRAEAYLARQRRREEAEAFAGSRDDFLRYCLTRVEIGAASAADLPRLHELSVRTRQFNSAGQPVSEVALAGLIGSADHRVITVRLADRYGDDGLVGGAVITAAWEVPLLMMSCRAMGRGVIEALLAWICLAAGRAGTQLVTVPCVVSPRNVPLRIALTAAGFRAETGGAGPRPALAGQAGQPAPAESAAPARYARRPDQPAPELPDWVTDRPARPPRPEVSSDDQPG